MGKKEKEKKEKPLDKMTAKELRELGSDYRRHCRRARYEQG